MTIDHTGEPGLRERKKLATREKLGWAAFRLATVRGLENVRVDDIAEMAGVSPRTFNNYFSSREEAICAVTVERAKRVGGALLARPPGEPLGEALIDAMMSQYTDGREPDKAMVVQFHLVMNSPALRGEFLKGMAAMEASLAEAIAERTGTDTAHDVFPKIVAAAVAGAARIAAEQWLLPETTRPYSELLREAVTIAASIADVSSKASPKETSSGNPMAPSPESSYDRRSAPDRRTPATGDAARPMEREVVC